MCFCVKITNSALMLVTHVTYLKHGFRKKIQTKAHTYRIFFCVFSS